jgi:flagellar basal-body rod modification protein FlgD
MTTPIDAVGRSAAATAATDPTAKTQASKNDALGKDAFLKLMVAQLKYQNPMSPLDGSQFLAQTAQFNMLEQLQEISKQSAQLVADEGSRTAASMLGRKVTYTDADGKEASGVVSGARLDPEGAVLMVGETRVPLSSVKQVTLAG